MKKSKGFSFAQLHNRETSWATLIFMTMSFVILMMNLGIYAIEIYMV